MCVCVCDVVSLSTRDINQVSVAISLTLKVDYLRTLSISRKRHVLWRRFQRDGMVQNPLKHLMGWFPWEITIVSNSLSMHEVHKEGKLAFVPTESLQWRSHSWNLQNTSLSTGLSTRNFVGLQKPYIQIERVVEYSQHNKKHTKENIYTVKPQTLYISAYSLHVSALVCHQNKNKRQKRKFVWINIWYVSHTYGHFKI